MLAPSGCSHHYRASFNKARRKVCLDVRCSAFLKVLKGLVGSGQGDEQLKPIEDSDVEFVEWLHNYDVNTSKVAIQTCGDEGRGLVARTRVRKGDTVLHVPSQLVIDADTAVSESLILKAVPDAAAKLSEWSFIALFLAELKWRCQQPHHQQQHKSKEPGAQSTPADATAAKWHPYMQVLPDNPGTVLSWTDTEVSKLLAGSALQRSAATLRNAERATWDEVRPFIQQAEQAGVMPQGAVSHNNVTWALQIMLSRLVRLSSKGDCQALVPWADFANHSPGSAAHLDWTQNNSGGVHLVADRDYAAGEQIYISYGERSCGELLLSYGFSPGNASSHPHEAALLRIGLQSNDPLLAEKAALLAAHGLPQHVELPIRMNALPAGLLQWAAFCAVPESNTAAGKQAAKRAGQVAAGQPDLLSLVQSTLPGLLQTAPGGVRLVSEMDAYSVVCGLAAASLPTELQAVAYKEVARCCNTAVKGLQASMPSSGLSNTAAAAASPSSGAPRADVVAGIKAHELRILARAEFLARNEAKALSTNKSK